MGRDRDRCREKERKQRARGGEEGLLTVFEAWKQMAGKTFQPSRKQRYRKSGGEIARVKVKTGLAHK